jgi:hypothetical protein
MSADKEFIDLLNKNEVNRIIAQRANAEALRDARDEGKAEGTRRPRGVGEIEPDSKNLSHHLTQARRRRAWIPRTPVLTKKSTSTNFRSL